MGHVTPTLDDHVGVNVITAIITCLNGKKVLTRSAPAIALRERVRECNDIARPNALRGLVWS